MADTRTFAETLGFKPSTSSAPTDFETLYNPEHMGNAANIAYGGFALAMAAKGACLTVPKGYHLYSMLGHYLGPALTDRPLKCSVRTIRQTRTFATRQVEVKQMQDSGEDRTCLIALADFQVREPALLVYSKPPSMKYTSWRELDRQSVQLHKAVESGKVSQKIIAIHKKLFAAFPRMYEVRPCPEGIFAQNISGMAKTNVTTQDSLPLDQKSNAEWYSAYAPFDSEADQMACLSWLMDGALSFSPLSFSHMFLDDASAVSSLDFALRLFSNDVDMTKWHLKEIQTHTGAEGRTYTEGRLYEEDGRCIASITQQSICRPKKDNKVAYKL
ncbi:acyl-CoA thioesterase II [Amniculicola lignicola CBS 123094]|uniref:Acyl-CoA thioesterase II n=1 Tax=Amniculicola lignicola CBS 123094 TaxID=1392246 RepID=A0A6A5WI88_9PLEO|nr:acyl-CoA thioesterase II [Amniculicola lignicola CBS 123094]